MNYSLKISILTVLSIAIGLIGCLQRTPSTTIETLPWAESYGRFYTRDLTRAQAEIPFPIILPSYLPKGKGNTIPPGITGPLRGYQYKNQVKIEILYIINLTDDIAGTIQIYEQNYSVSYLDPKLNPDFEYVEINGMTMLKTEGNFQEGPGVIYYFNQNNIYFEVGVYNFSTSESAKIVGSMLK